ncbi:MAG: trypsin-like peptidase domain-containing protein [Gemmatimonadota bacterium]
MDSFWRGRRRTGAVLLALIAGAGCGGETKLEAGETSAAAPFETSALVQTPPPNPTGPSAAAVSRELDESRETAVVRAAERVSASIVAVNVLRSQQVRARDPFFDDFFSPFGLPWGSTTTQLVPSLGSGFVIDATGIILTNDHVVRGAERILVSFPDGRDAEAELVGTDAASDVAVLRISMEGLTPVPVGSAEELRIGEWLVAFGNPFGHLLSNPEPSVTVGVTSALRRHIVPSQEDRGSYLGMIQTDAAINPGNSGGPLVNAAGEVVGMNTSIFSRSGGSEGMGFAVPIDRALRIADDILEYGRVRRAWLGMRVEAEVADAFGRTRGVRVAQVYPGSPAARAGLNAGDRLTRINGARLVTPLDFEAVLLDLRVGDSVSLEVNGNAPVQQMVAEDVPTARAPRLRVLDNLEVVSVTEAIRAERSIASPSGALVIAIPDTQGSALGLVEGDVIVGFNNARLRDAEELADRLAQLRPGSRAILVFERNGVLIERAFVQGG